MPPHHWRQVLQRLELTQPQREHLAASYERMLQQMVPILQARQQLGVQLATAAQPTTCTSAHIMQQGWQVGNVSRQALLHVLAAMHRAR